MKSKQQPPTPESMTESRMERLVRGLALQRILRTKKALQKEHPWFGELTEREQFDMALKVFAAQKSMLQMGRMLWDLVPTVLSIVAIVLAFWNK